LLVAPQNQARSLAFCSNWFKKIAHSQMINKFTIISSRWLAFCSELAERQCNFIGWLFYLVILFNLSLPPSCCLTHAQRTRSPKKHFLAIWLPRRISLLRLSRSICSSSRNSIVSCRPKSRPKEMLRNRHVPQREADLGRDCSGLSTGNLKGLIVLRRESKLKKGSFQGLE
jgi:hypothetical protein